MRCSRAMRAKAAPESMSLPYAKPPRAAAAYAAYLDVVWLPEPGAFYGALLVIDAQGMPIEFVYNSLPAPSGFLWRVDDVRRMAIIRLSHSLFDACEKEPALLVCREELGTLSFCRDEINPAVPFAQASGLEGEAPAAWSWLNNPPPPSHPAHGLAQSLLARGCALEPFDRIRSGWREVYPALPWSQATDDTILAEA